MIIYSWNMLYRNKELDRAFNFIAESDFDIFCLQEVPEEFLARLKTLPCHLDVRSDVERLFTGGVVHNFLVILSKFPIVGRGEIPYSDYWPILLFRTRLFVKLLKPFHFSKITNRGGLFVDVQIQNKVMRIFNIHLILAQPAWRLREFEMAMFRRVQGQPTIVCGDFNVLEARRVTSLNWMFGGKISDALFHTRERTTIEKRFVAHELHNPLRGSITHPFSRSQLDHILVSNSFSITKAEVLPDRFGSDHHPIRVEID